MKKFGFTLAEVLITLGIIGVVAALTIPALIQHYKKQETSTRLKRFYSVMQQAIKMSEVDNGDSLEWYKPDQKLNDDGKYDYDVNGTYGKEFFMKYLAPYIKYNKITDGKSTVDEDGNPSGEYTKVYFADGSTASIFVGSCYDIIFDSNGERKPNETGRDIFRFVVCNGSYNEAITCGGNTKKTFCPYVWRNEPRDVRLRRCKEESAAYCSGLLFLDNWEFKDDYPIKL